MAADTDPSEGSVCRLIRELGAEYSFSLAEDQMDWVDCGERAKVLVGFSNDVCVVNLTLFGGAFR